MCRSTRVLTGKCPKAHPSNRAQQISSRERTSTASNAPLATDFTAALPHLPCICTPPRPNSGHRMRME